MQKAIKLSKDAINFNLLDLLVLKVCSRFKI